MEEWSVPLILNSGQAILISALAQREVSVFEDGFLLVVVMSIQQMARRVLMDKHGIQGGSQALQAKLLRILKK